MSRILLALNLGMALALIGLLAAVPTIKAAYDKRRFDHEVAEMAQAYREAAIICHIEPSDGHLQANKWMGVEFRRGLISQSEYLCLVHTLRMPSFARVFSLHPEYINRLPKADLPRGTKPCDPHLKDAQK